MEVAQPIDERWHLTSWRRWPPSIMCPFARKSEVNTKIQFWVRTRIGNDLGEPRAANHNTSGVDASALETFDERSVHGMDHRNVVGVYDEEPLRLSVPKALGKVLPLR